MFPSALLPACWPQLRKKPPARQHECRRGTENGPLPAAIAEKRCSELFSLPMRPWKWTKTAISLPHRQEFAYGMAFFRNCGRRAVRAPFPGGWRQENPVSRLKAVLPVTDRPGSGGFACREGESRSRGVGRLDSSVNRSFHKRTCIRSRAGLPCR